MTYFMYFGVLSPNQADTQLYLLWFSRKSVKSNMAAISLKENTENHIKTNMVMWYMVYRVFGYGKAIYAIIEKIWYHLKH